MLQFGYGKTRFEATCEHVRKELKDKATLDEKSARDELLKIWDAKAVPKNKEDGVSVLVEGSKLANQLQDLKLNQKTKWALISEVWMEMVGYAGIHCDSYQHAKALSRGGELLSHLGLLMAQLGVVEEHKMQQFQSADSYNLIVL